MAIQNSRAADTKRCVTCFVVVLFVLSGILAACTQPLSSGRNAVNLDDADGSGDGNGNHEPVVDVPPTVVGIEPEPNSENPVESESQEYQLLLEGNVEPDDLADEVYFRAIDAGNLPEWIGIVDEHYRIVEVDPTKAPSGNSSSEVEFYTSFNEEPALDPDEGSTYDFPFEVVFYVYVRPPGD